MLFLLLNIVNIVVLKNNGLYIFSFNDNTDQWPTIFLCNRVMLLLLLLNIVNIVVLKNKGLYIFSFNDNTDNG